MDGMVIRKILYTLLLTFCTFGCGGCKLLENSVSNIGGWDISACVSGFDTCWEFYFDNADKFEGGFITAINGLTGEIK